MTSEPSPAATRFFCLRYSVNLTLQSPLSSRGDWIRTSGLMVPNHAL